MKKAVPILSFALLLSQSCGGSFQGSLQKVLDGENIPDIAKYSRLVIIPGSGCTGCITRSENYFLQNCSDTSILFVLTYNFSIKQLALRLNGENLERTNVLMDKGDRFHLSGHEESIYPIMCSMKDGRIIDIRKLN